MGVFMAKLIYKKPKLGVISVRVDPKLRYGLDLVARKQHISVSDAVVQAVDTYLQEKGLAVKELGQNLSLLDRLWSESESERIVNVAKYSDLASSDEICIAQMIDNLDDALRQHERSCSYTKNDFYVICDKHMDNIKMTVKVGGFEVLVDEILNEEFEEI
jgi:hypothetical protein